MVAAQAQKHLHKGPQKKHLHLQSNVTKISKRIWENSGRVCEPLACSTFRLVSMEMKWKRKESLEESRRWPQQRKVRSLFLQPTWQHMLVTMLLKSRLVRWGLRPPLLLLRLSKLFCSPAGTIKHSK